MPEVLCGGFLIDEYRPELIEMVLDRLTPDSVRIAVVGKKFEGQTDRVEKWYGTNYSLSPISEETLTVTSPIVINVSDVVKVYEEVSVYVYRAGAV